MDRSKGLTNFSIFAHGGATTDELRSGKRYRRPGLKTFIDAQAHCGATPTKTGMMPSVVSGNGANFPRPGSREYDGSFQIALQDGEARFIDNGYGAFDAIESARRAVQDKTPLQPISQNLAVYNPFVRRMGMSKLQDIPIKVEPASLAMSHDDADMLVPILHELLGMLRTLGSSGQGNILDLRHEPLSLEDIATLKGLLGQGEIDVSLNALGRTSIRETAVSGIWWITHYDQQGEIVDECIEISLCPDILKTSAEDLKPAIGRLQDKLNQYQYQSTPDDIDKRLGELGFSLKKATPDSAN